MKLLVYPAVSSCNHIPVISGFFLFLVKLNLCVTEIWKNDTDLFIYIYLQIYFWLA
jgi:hypothetical protein